MSEDIESLLNKQEKEVQKDKEIERIISSFRLDDYSILNLKPGCSNNDIKRQYRKLSLLIHPDKSDNPKASEAFGILKKSENNLQNDEKRKKLDKIYENCEKSLKKELNLSDIKLGNNTELIKKLKLKINDLLIEDEFLNRIEKKNEIDKKNELNSKRNELKEINELKRKADQDWENNRDNRVKSWQKFLKKKDKKKKGKVLI